jgi:tetratricopeptide (TPR) repeat protein
MLRSVALPKDEERVTKQTFIIAGIVAATLIGGGIFLFWQNHAQQNAMEQRLADLQRQVTNASRSGLALGGQPVAPEIGGQASVTTVSQDLTVLEKQRNIRIVMDEGWRLINQREPHAAAQAAEIFREGLEKVDPKNGQFFNGLGRALLIAGRPRDAIEAWRQGLAVAPQISDMQSGIGWAHWNLQEYDRAREAWEAALNINPRSLDAWSAMAWVYLALGQTEKSKEGFQVLYLSDRQNKDWILGLQMAQAKNTDPAQISKFFHLPDLAALKGPASLASAPRVETSAQH